MTVDEITARLGGPTEAAVRLGIKRTALWHWRRRGSVPPRHVPTVARILNVPAEQIWPALQDHHDQAGQKAA